MKPWYQVVTARPEVREGRSFSPDEFAIALEQVKAGTAPADYTDPAQFFARTCFTGALTSHSGMVLRRLAGQTANTAPALSLVTQFGGGKTHTLTALYHLAQAGPDAARFPGVADLIDAAGLGAAPAARVGVFVGNAWDPSDGRETPWIDLARQLAGDAGVAELGQAAAEAPPGTEALDRVFAAANGPALLLFDETLNFLNRHRSMAEPFYAFLQNLTVAVTGSRYAVAVISLPRSQVEMTDWDQEWQERITKVVNRVAQDLIANDESEISEVVRRRLFADLGSARMRRKVAKTYADWCFERNARLPAEWTAVDSAATDAKAQEFLRGRFESLLSIPPGHPVRVSAQVARGAAVPANPGRPGNAGAVDFAGVPGTVQASAQRAADYAGFRAATRCDFPRRAAGAAGRAAAGCRHNGGPRRRYRPRPGVGRRRRGRAEEHSPARGNCDTL